MNARRPVAQGPQELEGPDQQGQSGSNDVHPQAQGSREAVAGDLCGHHGEVAGDNRDHVSADGDRQDRDDTPADPTGPGTDDVRLITTDD